MVAKISVGSSLFGALAYNGEKLNEGVGRLLLSNKIYDDGTGNIGGVAGNTSETITSCYNNGGVSGSNNIGGIAGVIYAPVSNCYNIGEVSFTADGNKGEVVGRCADKMFEASSAEVANCYYLGETADLGVGTNDTSYIAGGYPVAAYNKSTADMIGGSFASTISSDFKEDYTAPNQVNDGYPILSWQ